MTKSLVQSQFGANAANYVTSKVHAKGASLARLVDLVAPQKTWRMLDIATGAGHTALAFAPHVAHVVASDLTPQMLVQAANLAWEIGFANVETAEADAENLPFDEATFDLVTCRIAPHHFQSPPAFVAEAARVLRPGGTFAMVDNISPDAELTLGFSRAELTDAAITYNAFEKIRDPSHVRALAMAEWTELLEECGLELIHKEHNPKVMDFSDWCRNMSVPAETAVRLDSMLRNPSPAFAAYIRPHEEEGALAFVLEEAILIGRKPG